MRKQKGSEIRFFIDFWWIWDASWPSKMEPRRAKIDVEMASKFDQFWKASWNATFSAQEPPRGASAADRRRRWSPPWARWGGFRRGKQEPLRRRIRKEMRRRIRRAGVRVPHAVPGGRRIEAPLGGEPPPNVFGVWSAAIRKVIRETQSWDMNFLEGVRTDFIVSQSKPRTSKNS